MKLQRKQIAEDALKIIKQGFFLASDQTKIFINEQQTYAEVNTKLYSPLVSDQLLKERVSQKLSQPTIVKVNQETTLNVTRQLIAEGHDDVVCLNFASAKNPGGGFLGGAQAQEESIARASGLYPCLLKAPTYYDSNRKSKSCIYTDHIIYSPLVPIFKNEEGENLDKLVCAAVITAPAVNAGVIRQREPQKVDLIEPIMKRRIEKVLAIALEHGHKTIVLGAWGCGVFRNDPDDVAQYFKEVIETKFKDEFRKILFAVYSRNERFVKPFLREFGKG